MVLHQLNISVFIKAYHRLNFTFSVQSTIKASIVKQCKAMEDLVHAFLRIVTYHPPCYHFLIFV